MGNPTLVCSDTTAVLWGFLFLKKKTKPKPTEIWEGDSCYCLREKRGILGTPGAVGYSHHHLKSVLLVYSSECSFCVKN